MLKVIKRRKIGFLSKETEEFLFCKISDDKVTPQEITLLVKGFSKLKVGAVNWRRIKPFQVYFCKDIAS